MRSFGETRSGRERQSICCENGVAGASHIHSLITAIDGDLGGRHAGFKERHPIAATRHKESGEFHFVERLAATALQFFPILPDRGVVQVLELRFIRRRRCDARACVRGQVAARIERGDQFALARGQNGPDQSGRGHAEAVVADGQSVR